MKYASYAADLKFVCGLFHDIGPINIPRIFPLYKRTFDIDSLFSSTLSATHRGNFPLLHIISEVERGRHEALREASILVVLFIGSVNDSRRDDHALWERVLLRMYVCMASAARQHPGCEEK